MLEKFLKRLQGIHLNDVDHDGEVIFIKTNTNRLFTVLSPCFLTFKQFFRKEVLLSYQISSKKFLPHSPPAVFHLPVKSFLKSKAGNIEILRSLLLRYESSTFILCKELSSSIFAL